MQDKDWMNLHQIYPAVDHPTTPCVENTLSNDSYRPPMNWCGEQAVDEIGTVYRCYICGRVLQEDSHLCELCVRQHGGKVNV